MRDGGARLVDACSLAVPMLARRGTATPRQHIRHRPRRRARVPGCFARRRARRRRRRVCDADCIPGLVDGGGSVSSPVGDLGEWNARRGGGARRSPGVASLSDAVEIDDPLDADHCATIYV